jgi:chaperonin GroEL
VGLVRKALAAPLRQIAINAGKEGGVVLAKVLSKTGAFGYNADTDTYEDLIKVGVIDPAKVVRAALQNGSSVARVLLSTDCIVTEKPVEDDEDAGGPGGHGMDDMGGMM